MTTTATETAEFRAVIERDIYIEADPATVFQSILEEMCAIPDGKGVSMNLKLEAFPGGRWYRDLGNNTGHLWGHVQVIKPPTLIEVIGPMMISSAVINHVTYRIKQSNNVSQLLLTHKMFGDFDPSIPANVGGGWQRTLEAVKSRALKS